MKRSLLFISIVFSVNVYASETGTALFYLDKLRKDAGMSVYHLNAKLGEAAQNHADYLLEENVFGHQESNTNNSHYTGEWLNNRLDHVAYDWTAYAEAISKGDSSVIHSLDGLFVSIYHRLGFLSFNTEELGFGSVHDDNYGNAFTYALGTSTPRYASDVQNDNPAIVKWPPENYQNAQPAFFNNEFPDPLPECQQNGPSGNPISIQFNPAKTDTISINTFSLHDENGVSVDTKTIDDSNLGDRQFAMFPINRLDWNKNYTASFSYTEGGAQKDLSWSFKTRILEYPGVILDNTASTYEVSKNSTYSFYVVPDDCNDTDTYYSSYDPSKLEPIGTFIDPNTHNVKTVGDVGSTTTLELGNGKTFSFHIFTEEVSNLTFTDTNTTSVTLHWDHDLIGATGFKIFRNGALITPEIISEKTYTDNSLVANTTYTYTVKATND